jgi:predicted XRE-type DNA-binding protein
MAEDTRIVHGSGNVFADIVVPEPEIHLLKAELVLRMMRVMRRRGLTQARAAKLMGIKQPDVSNLVRGRFRGYSIERLLTLLHALDQDIEIVIRDKPKSKRPARLVVRVAA